MTTPPAASAWLGKANLKSTPDIPGDSSELVRMWQGFMTARLTLGLVLLALQMLLFATGTAHNSLLVAISIAYFVSTLAARVFIRPRPLGHTFNKSWGFVVGMDVLVFSSLQLLQGSTVNYTPLFALPILLASVLGSLRLALGTAASVTVLLLGNSLWAILQPQSDATPYFVQSALSGVGYFVIALLGNQLATRLATEAQRTQVSQRAIRIQREVNALVIESLPDGVLVVDAQGQVRAANPAARQLLGSPAAGEAPMFDLHREPGWQPLRQLTQTSVSTGEGREEDVTIWHGDEGPRKVHARTRLAAPHGLGGESLCVLFLQDQRELEARMRTEKLASMGRMSTAVAHEIRNPLAAIAQANALLDEDLTDPRLKQLTAMVGQNAKRLAKIVDDILNVSRVQPAESERVIFALDLNATLHRVCDDWATQSGSQHQMRLTPCETNIAIQFDPEHLRRVLVNLLDNAHRYASQRPESIQVRADLGDAQGATISVWSDGAPLDPSIERHLFEPFFSSESRSSGLGLYICRELCDGHHASISYRRTVHTARGHAAEGNEFVIAVVRADPQDHAHLLELNATPWQTTLY
jgi:two-component system sensor histidine kinase PilS (NtrC family)